MRAAAQSLLFRKILKLRSLQDKTVGEVCNVKKINVSCACENCWRGM